jgi:hypothetical protein
MNLVERAKKILLNPKEEWAVIDQENTSVSELVTTYLIPLALIPAIATFIGYGIVGLGFLGPSLSWGIKQAVISFIQTAVGAFVTALIINALSTSFGSQSDFRKAMQLVVYSFTPMMVAGIVLILPALGIISLLAGIYGLYILYIGLKPLMKTPDDKVTTYFVISLVILIAVYFVIGLILTAILITSVGLTIPHSM